MLAAMHDQEATLRELIKKGECPLDFRQMKVRGGVRGGMRCEQLGLQEAYHLTNRISYK
jgi:hypothetical protein